MIKNIRESVRTRLENDELYAFYFTIIENMAFGKFNFENLPDELKKEYILRPLIEGGTGAIAMMDYGQLYSGFPIFEGVTAYPNVYEKASLHNPKGDSKILEVDKEIAVGFNNPLHTPEFEIFRYAEVFTEIDKSILVNIKNTRISPLQKVRDSKEAKQFKQAFENIYEGKPNTITLDRDVFDELKNSSEKDEGQIMLTRPEEVDKIQYLSKLHDDMLRRLCNLHGLPMSTTGKMAQITKDELMESQYFSHVYTSLQMEYLERYVDDINRIFNLNIEVEYGEAWKHFAIEKSVSPEEYVEEIVKENNTGGEEVKENENELDAE